MDAVKVTRSRLTGLTVYAIPFRAAAEAMMTLASNPSAPRSASSPSRTPMAGIDAPSPCPLCRAGGGFSPNPRRTDKCRPRESKFIRTEGQIIDILGHRTGGHNALARNVGLAYSLGGGCARPAGRRCWVSSSLAHGCERVSAAGAASCSGARAGAGRRARPDTPRGA
jgi:hypothetical protein